MARKKITPGKKTTAAAKSTDAVKSMAVDVEKKNKGKASEWFSHFAQQTATITGKPLTFILAVVIIIVWGISGPIFNYSDTWQLIINTSTTIVTFLMVFIIQNSQKSRIPGPAVENVRACSCGERRAQQHGRYRGHVGRRIGTTSR